MSLQRLLPKSLPMLNFRRASEKDRNIISSLISTTPEGAAAFSVLHTASGELAEFFLTGEDENGIIRSIIFDSGDEYFLIYGDEFPDLLTQSKKNLMIFSGNSCRAGSTEKLEGREIMQLYSLLSGEDKLSFDNERRYVLRLRAVNSGLAAVFGIKKDGILISSAAISSMNGKYAVISDVFTRQEYRRRGLAYECLMSATDFALKNGRIPVLLCEDKMCPYYEKAGFVIYGKM